MKYLLFLLISLGSMGCQSCSPGSHQEKIQKLYPNCPVVRMPPGIRESQCLVRDSLGNIHLVNLMAGDSFDIILIPGQRVNVPVSK